MFLRRTCDSTVGGASRKSGFGKAPMGDAWIKLTDKFPLETFQCRPSNDWFVWPKVKATVAPRQSSSAIKQSGEVFERFIAAKVFIYASPRAYDRTSRLS